jgi:hypothetical protein
VYAARGFLQKLVTDLVVRARQLRLPNVRPGLTELRGAVRAPLDRVANAVRGSLDRVANAALVRQSVTAAGVAVTAAGVAARRPIEGLHALRSRLRSTRLGRSADGLIVIPLLGLALVLGVFAATAATKSSSPSGEVRLTPAANASDAGDEGEVVTETIRRKGKTVRVVRYEQTPGRVVTVSGRSVTLPVTLAGPPVTSTVHDTRTHVVTVTDTVTTTEQVVVISTETEYITTTVEDSPPPDTPQDPPNG